MTPVLVAAQRDVVTTTGRQVVLAGPASGASTALVAWAAARVRPGGAQPLVLVPSRRAAARLRDHLEAGLAGRVVPEPLARTPQSLAWALLREHARRTDGPPPRLVTASELDEVVAELLAGHEAAGSGGAALPPVRWPAHLDAHVRRSRRFRDEVRELAARVVEHGQDATGLARLARAHRRPEWAAAARLLQEVEQVAGLRGDGGLDPAGTVADAADLLADPRTGLAVFLRGLVGHLGVDDAHDLTPAGWSLVREVTDLVADVCVVGDPDSATQAFRGAVPTALPRAVTWLAGPGAPVTERRLVQPLGMARAPAGVAAAVAREVGGPAPLLPRGGPVGSPRGEVPEGCPAARVGTVAVDVCLDAADEAHVVAGRLRAARQRPDDPLSWSDMAVLVRSGEQAARLRRALAADDVPVHVPGVPAALRDEPVVSLLLQACEVAADPGLLDPTRLERLAVGPLGGADPVRWRRLVRLARSRAAARTGRAVGGEEALEQVCVELRGLLEHAAPSRHPGRPVGVAGLPPAVAAPLLRLAEVLRAGRVAVARGPEECLWAVWETWGVAPRWRATALGGGPGADRADSDLDAVVALVEEAGRWSGLHPTGGVEGLVAHIRSRGVGDDRLVTGRAPDAVTLTTPAGAVGLRWRLVVVAGVQDGAWPDPRVRGSLLGLTDLGGALRGQQPVAPGGTAAHAELRREARRGVLRDELRLFHVAVSRAAEELVVTAVDDAGSRPSDLVTLVRRASGLDPPTPPRPRATHETLPAPAHGQVGGHEAAAGVSGPALVALLRRRLLADDVAEAERAEVATALARLAAAGVRGADPAQWAWLHDPGHAAHPAAGAAAGATAGADPADAVVVSPSSVGRYLACPLQWYLDGVGGRRASETAQGLGTLVHSALEQVPDGDLERMQAVVDAGWDDLELGGGWVSQHQRARARGMLERLSRWVAEQRAAGVSLVAAEQEVDLLLELPAAGPVRVRGTADRVERLPDGSVRVVDLKTGTSAATKAAAAEDPQLELYQLALTEGPDSPGPSGGALLLYVGTGTARAAERLQPRLDGRRRTDALERLDAVAAGMGAGTYPATPNDRCRTCAVASSCPASPQGRRLPAPGGDGG